jgi:hypothetical protein
MKPEWELRTESQGRQFTYIYHRHEDGWWYPCWRLSLDNFRCSNCSRQPPRHISIACLLLRMGEE